jgi:hypothetical protein
MSTHHEETEAKRAEAQKTAIRYYYYIPKGLDILAPSRNAPPLGQVVVKVQPHGCPKNGTFGRCYVEDAGNGTFYGLVLLASLRRIRKH